MTWPLHYYFHLSGWGLELSRYQPPALVLHLAGHHSPPVHLWLPCNQPCFKNKNRWGASQCSNQGRGYLLVIAEPSNVKLSVTSSTELLILIDGSAHMSWPMTEVFLMLIQLNLHVWPSFVSDHLPQATAYAKPQNVRSQSLTVTVMLEPLVNDHLL